MLEEQVKIALADANKGSATVDCANPTARGFPFRIGLYCDSVSFADPNGTSLSVGPMRTAAQIYNPFHIVGELDGPALLDVPAAGSLSVSWQALRASVRLDTPLPERISVEATDLAAGRPSTAPLFSAKSFEGHVRPNGADVDIAGSFSGLAADQTLLQQRVLPELSGDLDATLANGVALLQSRLKSLRGQSATIRALNLSIDQNTGLGLTGTIAADESGLIDADLMLTVRNPNALAAAAAQAFPEAKSQIDNAAIGLAALGETPSLPLMIVKGKARLGFVSLGDIPPI